MRSSRSLAVLTISSAACHAPAPLSVPGRGASQLDAELSFIAAYASAMSSGNERLVVELKRRSLFEIYTDPPILESTWEIRAGKKTLSMMLDCSMQRGWRDRDWHCGAHNIPLPARTDERLVAVLRAVARTACDGTCRDCEMLTLARRGSDIFRDHRSLVTYIDVSRCKTKRSFRVSCPLEPPFECTVERAPDGATEPLGVDDALDEDD